MKIVDGKKKLIDNLLKQLDMFWCETDKGILSIAIEDALIRMEHIINNISKTNIYTHTEEDAFFSPYHSVQYSIFLYLCANSLFKRYGKEKSIEADKIYYLNKIMNGVDWFYQIELPDIFYAEHPVGSVMGRAKYGDFFFFYQGCTVGGVRENEKVYYPCLGKNVMMCANSKVLGKANIGDNVIIAPDCTIKNQTVPSDVIVFGQSPNLVIKERKKDVLYSNIWNEL